MKKNLTGNVVLSDQFTHSQFIYGSHLYGTNFGVFCDFTINYPDKDDKKKCQIINAEISILNYKGIVDVGILGEPYLQIKEHNFVNKNDKKEALVLDLNLQAIVAGESKYSQKVKLVDKNSIITEDHLFIVERTLIPINVNSPDKPVKNGIFENEFYYRDGIQFIKREITEVPDSFYRDNTSPTYPEGNSNFLNKPSGKCANSINVLSIF